MCLWSMCNEYSDMGRILLFVLATVLLNSYYVAARSLRYSSYPFPLVTREEWGAEPPLGVTPLSLPAQYVVIHHSYQPGVCLTKAECVGAMRSMQRFHQVDQGWGDIGYNFAVGGEGSVYEGRGWSAVGAHAIGFNSISIGIVFIGDWRTELPPPQQLATTQALIREGVSLGIISPDYKLVGHRQVMNTECPGGALYRHIQQWKHYVPEFVLPVPAPELFYIVAASIHIKCVGPRNMDVIYMIVLLGAVEMRDAYPASVVGHYEENELSLYDFPYKSRRDWGARPSAHELTPLNITLPYVVIHHSYIPPACYSNKECVNAMRAMQNMHIDKNNWWDIGYHFAVGSNGVVYEGRGWGKLGAHALHFNSVSVGICLIGDWRQITPTPAQVKSAQKLIQAGIKLGHIKPDYKLVGHRQVRDTECPGNALFNEIQAWPHYVSFPRSHLDLLDVPELSEEVKEIIRKEQSPH
nr:peptidoglycan-recognition protein LF-like [Plodia interpunctella]